MRKLYEILRLALSMKMSSRDIAASCSTSHTTVLDYLKLAKKAGLDLLKFESAKDEAE